MIELTDEMRTAVKRRMGIPDGDELDPWMGPAIEDVLAIVERDYTVRLRIRVEVDPDWACRRCGSPLTKCFDDQCASPALCGEGWCGEHLPEGGGAP